MAGTFLNKLSSLLRFFFLINNGSSWVKNVSFVLPACQDPCQARKTSYLTFRSNTVFTNEI